MGREAWGRYRRLEIPQALLCDGGMCLVQAYLANEPIEHAIPVDQVVLHRGKPSMDLLLPPGHYTLRSSNESGVTLNTTSIKVE